MKQTDFEDLFRNSEEPKLSDLPYAALTFSKGNNKRSLVGKEWYYYGESENTYSLYKDIFVKETPDKIFIDMYEEDIKLNSLPVCIEKKKLKNLYPVQDLFPKPMDEQEARERLRKHFIEEEERSTTIESIGD